MAKAQLYSDPSGEGDSLDEALHDPMLETIDSLEDYVLYKTRDWADFIGTSSIVSGVGFGRKRIKRGLRRGLGLSPRPPHRQ